jgi:branched-chain amino acid transport system permease protein
VRNSALLAAAGIAVVVGATAPWALPPFYVHLLALVCLYSVWAMSFGLVMGQLGLVSFGHAALFGGGAYAAAWVALNLTESLFAGMAAGLGTGLVLGAATGLMLGRLSGVAFAIGTLAFGGMLARLANSWVDVTGGSDGLVGLPFPRALGHPLTDRALYWLALGLLASTAAGLSLLVRSRAGMVLHAVRDNPRRAEASGIPVYAIRCITLAGAGAIAGLAGSLSAYLVGSVAPSAVDWTASGTVLVMAVIGGPATILGPALGAAAYTLLEQVLSQVLPDYRLVLGAVFIVIVLVAPQGVAVRRAVRLGN